MTEFIASSDDTALFLVWSAFAVALIFGALLGGVLLFRRPKNERVITRLEFDIAKLPPPVTLDMAGYDERAAA